MSIFERDEFKDEITYLGHRQVFDFMNDFSSFMGTAVDLLLSPLPHLSYHSHIKTRVILILMLRASAKLIQSEAYHLS